MITIPEGVNLSALFSDFYAIALPFCGIVFAGSVGAVLIRLLKRARP